MGFWIRYMVFSPREKSRATIGELWAIFFDGELVGFAAARAHWNERYRTRGVGRYAAALHGASEVALPITLATLTFFAVRTIFAFASLDWTGILVFGGWFVFFVLFLRGMIVGVMDVLFVPVRPMDITIENNGLGVMVKEERWYLFLDLLHN